MLPESHSAVVARNEVWAGPSATEPYEVGWAREAVVFVRALAVAGSGSATARVQLSPDGMRWVDEGTSFPLPTTPGAIGFARVAHFGLWLRVACDLPEGLEVTVLVNWALKA
jgi:hypothetical protein